MGSAQQLTKLADQLQANYKLFPFTFSGHGGKAFQAEFSMQAFVDELLSFVKAESLHGAAVFGYSMGGYVALSAEQQQPGTFSQIMTLGTKFNWTPEGAAKESAMLKPEIISEKVPAYAQALQAEHGDSWKELCTRTAEMMVKLGNTPLLDAERLAQLNIPVRIGLGDRDKMVTLDESVSAYRALQHGSMTMLPATPHPLDRVDSAYLANELKAFFA